MGGVWQTLFHIDSSVSKKNGDCHQEQRQSDLNKTLENDIQCATLIMDALVNQYMAATGNAAGIADCEYPAWSLRWRECATKV